MRGRTFEKFAERIEGDTTTESLLCVTRLDRATTDRRAGAAATCWQGKRGGPGLLGHRADVFEHKRAQAMPA